MKKWIFAFGFFFIILIQYNQVKAEEEASQVEIIQLNQKPGIKPDSPFYFIDKGFEDFRLWLTKNEEKEAALLLKYAEERLAELDALDRDEVDEYIDELYQEYGFKLEKVNNIISKLIVNDKISQSKAEKLTTKLSRTASLDTIIDSTSLSEEIKQEIQTSQLKSFSVAVTLGLNEEEVIDLKGQGFGYGEILKLNAIATLSDLSIEELMYLDIFTTVTSDKEIDFVKLATELGLEQSEIKTQFRQYNQAVKQNKMEQKEKIREDLNQKLSNVVLKHKEQLIQKIDEIYQDKLSIIKGLNLNLEDESEVLLELNDLKYDLINKIEDKVESGELSPSDIGKLNQEIVKAFNELISEIEVDEESKQIINDELKNYTELIRSTVQQIIALYEKQKGFSLEENQKQELLSEILEDADEEYQRGKGEPYIRQLQKIVFEELDDLVEDDDDNSNNGKGKGKKNK